MKISIIKYIIFLLAIIHICSCEKFVVIEPSPDLINSTAVFSDDKTATSAVSGVYVFMRAQSPSLANGALSIFTSLSADDLYNTSATLEYPAFANNAILSSSSVVNSQLWSVAYKVIYRTNAIIEGLDRTMGVSEPVRRQLKGEMKVVRSLYYFYLVNLFGDVPLVVSTDFEISGSLSRTPSEKIYQYIIEDLNDAISLLKPDYPQSSNLTPNKWTAAALLSRVYLYHRDWPKAEATSSEIIGSGQYHLENNLSEVFLINSNEIIWQIPRPNDGGNTAEGGLFIPSSSTALPVFAITNYLLNAFETGDQRKPNWIKSNLINGQNYFYPYKYKSRTNTPVAEYDIVFRLAEQYLIRSEARARQNNLTGSQSDLNIIRARAGLGITPSVTQPSLLSSIEHERQTELFAEWGHRWFDLKRYGRIDAVLSAIKGTNWQSADTLYPIPFVELQYNPMLVQNPGY